jgi:ADP-heptose:LPS heptosyltransferase
MIVEQWREARNILLVRLDNLGDVLLTTPAFHAVRQAFPAARLTLLASPIGAQVAPLNPDLNDVIIYQAPWMDSWHLLPLDSEREQRMIALLKKHQFDAAIIFTSFRQSPLLIAYLCYLADIPLRLAASIDGPGSLLTTCHKYPGRLMHEVERGLDLVRAIGVETNERDMVLKVPTDGMAAIATLLSSHHISEHHPLVVVHPGCNMPARTYPWPMYGEVINLLVEQLGAFVFLTGSEDEAALVSDIYACVHEHYRTSVLPLAGELSFSAFSALIKIADLTVTNNTGPMHMASALKTPVVVLFALTNPPEQWGPWQVPHRLLYHDVVCRICYNHTCPYQHECLRMVSPQTVVDAALDLLQEVQKVDNTNNAGSTEPEGHFPHHFHEEVVP